jgi:solute carrier family 39 (zinc transporter), member 7
MWTSLPPFWQAIMASVGISTLPNLLLYLLPSKALSTEKPWCGLFMLNVLLCFASGAILGDVMIHAIPHLISPHDHDHEHDNENDEHHEHKVEESNHGDVHNILVSVTIVLGFAFFLIGDRVVSRLQKLAVMIAEKEEVGHAKKQEDIDAGTDGERGRSKTRSSSRSKSKSKSRMKSKGKSKKVETKTRHIHTHKHAVSIWELKPAGLLSICADTVHNFTDGLMLGAVFASGNADLKVSTFIAVLVHEVPHELADFAVLLQSGFDKGRAIRTQFITAIAAFVGTVVGFSVADSFRDISNILVALVSGGFLYLATTNILPLTHDVPQTNLPTAPWTQMALEFLAFGCGVGIMVVVAFLELMQHDNANDAHSHDHHQSHHMSSSRLE